MKYIKGFLIRSLAVTAAFLIPYQIGVWGIKEPLTAIPILSYIVTWFMGIFIIVGIIVGIVAVMAALYWLVTGKIADLNI